ncbi:MAG: hypothetical protein Q8M01_17750 [Rubrivivax sp.]|nr:hypothetical protein [Rubrivivax sp.]
MENLLPLIGLAAAALLVVAIGVAWWEQMGARAAARRTLHAPPPHAVSVDVKLDELAAEPARPTSDQAARQAALGSAMARMSRAAAPAPASLAWIDTQPIVAASLRAGPGNRQPEPGAESRTGH